MRTLLILLLLATTAHAESYYDGCNTCTRDKGGAWACTAMWCGEPPDIEGVALSKAEAAIEKGSLQRCYRRCEKNHPPMPSPSPKPTVAPLDCDPIGGQQKFTVGQERMFCFTAGPGSTFVAIEATSPANVGCAYFQLELTEPSGRKTLVDGASYPIMGSSEPRVVGGKYYFWVSPLWLGEQPGCDTYVLTVR